MYYKTMNIDEIRKYCSENPGLWAVGERDWDAESYTEILETKGWKPELPHVFSVKDLTPVLDKMESVCELFLYNSSRQLHLVRWDDNVFLAHESTLAFSDDKLRSYRSILREGESRYSFAVGLGVLENLADSFDYLFDPETNEWRLYHE
jgi:hypothetical protein